MTDLPPGFFEGTGMPDPGWWEALWPNPALVLKSCCIASGIDVVDLCAGDGWFTLQLAKLARHVWAVDIDGALLDASKVRLAEAGIKNCTCVEADAFDLAEHVPSQMDHVFLANAFHGVPDRGRLARVVRSVLKDGGLFSIVNWHAIPREETPVLGQPRGPATRLRMSHEQTVTTVEQAGFTVCNVMDVSPYHYAAIFQR